MGNEEKKNEYRRKCSVEGFCVYIFFLFYFDSVTVLSIIILNKFGTK